MERYIFNPFTIIALILFGVLALLVLPLIFLDLGAPMVSIGGAGTFDGIFLAGVIAAFLA